MSDNKWAQPTDVSNLDMAFPAKVLHLMPPEKEIPEEFSMYHGNSKWNKLIADWFFCGIKNLKLTPRVGIDETKAMRHIKTILGSFEPKHEHKEAACAYLMSLWFEDATWETREREKR